MQGIKCSYSFDEDYFIVVDYLRDSEEGKFNN